MLGLAAALGPATIAEAMDEAHRRAPSGEEAVPKSSVMPEGRALAAPESPIRPFHVSVSDADRADLRRRIAATKWPDRELVPDASQGVQRDTTKKRWRVARVADAPSAG